MAKTTLQTNAPFGAYFLTKLIARGGMAEIYLASTQGAAGFEKQLALKVIHAEYANDQHFIQMLVDEAKITVKLNHPNIVQTFDLGRVESNYFISMEYVDGADYFQLLKDTAEMQDEFPIAAALLTAREALLGLDYAHQRCDDAGNPLNIIHRDISPQNLLISRHGEVKLTDFGIAKAATVSHRTRAGVIKGKLVYMSPEQSTGDPMDHRTDIFSAGIVLYESLTGGSLYRERNPVKLLEKVRLADIPPPSSRRPAISRELDVLVMKALMPSPADRYQTALEFSEAITQYLRYFSPGYNTANLGNLVETILAGRRPSAMEQGAPLPPPVPVEQAPSPQGPMARDDFVADPFSIIFSTDDMRKTSPRESAQTDAIEAPTNPVPVSSPSAAKPPPVPGSLPRVPPPPPQLPRGKLILLEDASATQFPLMDKFVIGRAGDLRLGDARVSRRHAVVDFRDGQHWLEDLDSSNGTFVNDVKIENAYLLQHEDLIRIGPFMVRFEREATRETILPPEDQVPQPPPASRALPWEAASRREETSRQPSLPEVPPAPLSEPPPVVMRPPPAPVSMDEPQYARADSPVGHDFMSPAPGGDHAVAVLRLGTERLSLDLGERLPMRHALLVNGSELVGVAASIIRRDDGYWLDPDPGGQSVSLNGRPLDNPALLNSGDTVIIGPVELEFQEPR